MDVLKRPVEPTIRANFLGAIVQKLPRMPRLEELLRTCIGPGIRLDDIHEKIPLSRFVAFMEALAGVSADPALGAKLGAQFPVEECGPLGVLMLAAPSLRAALLQCVSFGSLLQSGTQVELNVAGAMPEYSYRISDPAIWPRRQDAEFTLSLVVTAVRALLGAQWNPVEVHFEHDPGPGGAVAAEAALSRIFRAPVSFGQGANRLLLRTEDLTRPVSRRHTAMAPYMERYLQDLARAEPADSPPETFASVVTRVVSRRLGRACVDVESIARDMGISSRTLQRRLVDEGTSFREVVRSYRAQIAERMLKDGQTTITSIAHSVGYADTTAFSRAFKSMNGCSPRDHRGMAGMESGSLIVAFP